MWSEEPRLRTKYETWCGVLGWRDERRRSEIDICKFARFQFSYLHFLFKPQSCESLSTIIRTPNIHPPANNVSLQSPSCSRSPKRVLPATSSSSSVYSHSFVSFSSPDQTPLYQGRETGWGIDGSSFLLLHLHSRLISELQIGSFVEPFQRAAWHQYGPLQELHAAPGAWVGGAAMVVSFTQPPMGEQIYAARIANNRN